MNTVLVDPARIVCVHVQTPEGESVYRCISCRYIQVEGPAIGVELIYDPSTPAPGAPYYVSAANLQWVIIDPNHLVRIHPYGTS